MKSRGIIWLTIAIIILAATCLLVKTDTAASDRFWYGKCTRCNALYWAALDRLREEFTRKQINTQPYLRTDCRFCGGERSVWFYRQSSVKGAAYRRELIARRS